MKAQTLKITLQGAGRQKGKVAQGESYPLLCLKACHAAIYCDFWWATYRKRYLEPGAGYFVSICKVGWHKLCKSSAEERILPKLLLWSIGKWKNRSN